MSEEQEVQSSGDMATTRQEVKREVVEFVKMIVWFLVLFFIVKTYIVEGYEVQGPSMDPTLKDRERILVLKLPHILSQYRLFNAWEPLQPSDVVIFDSPVETNKRYVKRVIAKGPHQQPATNTVSAQGTFADTTEKVSVQFDHGSVYVNKKRIPELYLPDNQRTDDDSQPELFLGAGDYYVLGDNRAVSKDSRSFGPINDERIIGKALFCFWPPSHIRIIR